MKAKVEIPGALLRKAKATAAEQGVSLKALLIDALREHLKRGAGSAVQKKPAAAALHRSG